MITLFRLLGIGTNLLNLPNPILFGLGMLFVIIVAYLLGSLNSAILVSKYRFGQDIRNFGSGNAGLTNMNRVYGGSAAVLTFAGDILKQIIAVFIGILCFDQMGAYIAGMFCMLGHIAPIYFHFKGGKGVLTAATMILLIDWRIFVVLAIVFGVVLLLTRFVSLASLMAAFTYPAAVYYAYKETNAAGVVDIFSLMCAIFISCIIFFMHRQNIKRLFNGTESKFSFKKTADLQHVLDKEDPESDKTEERQKNTSRRKKRK